MHWHERFTKASREGRLWLLDTDFCSGNLCSITRDEVVGCLFWRETRNRWKNTKGVAGQEDDVLRVTAAGIHGTVVDEFDWIGAARVLCFADIGEVGHTVSIENNVLKNGSLADRMEDIRLFFLTEINAFGITSPLNVKDSIISPAVFIIPNQASVRVCRKGRLPCSGKSKK